MPRTASEVRALGQNPAVQRATHDPVIGGDAPRKTSASRNGAPCEASPALTAACELALRELKCQLTNEFSHDVQPPFVIAGDIPRDELRQLHDEVCAPFSGALRRMYFDQPVDRPIVMVVLHDDESFRQTAWQLDQYRPQAYSGYYHRRAKRIVVNREAGRAAILHELIHAWAHIDFADMPEWFDEGLAAVHEQAELTDDRLLLTSHPTWRMTALRELALSGEMPSVTGLLSHPTFRDDREALHYALAYGLCQYLSERGVLGPFYRKLRQQPTQATGPLLQQLLDVDSSAAIDDAFRAWLTAG